MSQCLAGQILVCASRLVTEFLIAQYSWSEESIECLFTLRDESIGNSRATPSARTQPKFGRSGNANMGTVLTVVEI